MTKEGARNNFYYFGERVDRYYSVDEGIRGLVMAVNGIGVETEASCEGHVDRGYQYPWIGLSRVEVDSELNVLRQKLDEFNITSKIPFELQRPWDTGALRLAPGIGFLTQHALDIIKTKNDHLNPVNSELLLSMQDAARDLGALIAGFHMHSFGDDMSAFEYARKLYTNAGIRVN